MPQETFPDNLQVKFPSECQLVCQVTIQQNSKEGTQLKCQRNFKVPIQVPQQFICQIESSRKPRNFSRDMLSIMPSSPGFGCSNGDSSGSPSDKPTKYPSLLPIINPAIKPS